MVGAQFAYWRDYAADQRWRLFGKWHVVMPLLTRALGYFPGKRLGWMEDTPQGWWMTGPPVRHAMSTGQVGAGWRGYRLHTSRQRRWPSA